MAIEEYFGDWMPCIDKKLLLDTIKHVGKDVQPKANQWFKVFRVCDYKALNTVFLLQDPYPQRDIATGIALGNKDNTPISPSLFKFKERLLYLDYPRYLCTFDQTLESWCRQGVLMLNTALTVQTGKPASQQLLWRPFMESFLKRLCTYNCGLVFVLMGSYARSFKWIVQRNNHIIECNHPAWYARNNCVMPDIFTKINNILFNLNHFTVKWTSII